jgi:hypothetical protein
MGKAWAAVTVALGAAAIASAAHAEPGPQDGAQVLCQDYKAIELAALDDFQPIAGKPAKVNPLVRLAPALLAPKLAPAKLMLPDADECDLRPSVLRRGKNAYSCLWKSQQPDFAAVDQARRIAACLGAAVTKSDFGSDLNVVTPLKARFRLITEHGYDGADGYAVRLLVDGPQF